MVNLITTSEELTEVADKIRSKYKNWYIPGKTEYEVTGGAKIAVSADLAIDGHTGETYLTITWTGESVSELLEIVSPMMGSGTVRDEHTITVPSNATGMTIEAESWVSNIQFEDGEVATPYEPRPGLLEYPDGFKEAIDGLVLLKDGTADATAYPNDIRRGKTAYSKGVKYTGRMTEKAAATYHPSGSDQTIYGGQYLDGNQTIKGVTVAGLAAADVRSGVTVKIGDADDDDRIMSVTGSAYIPGQAELGELKDAIREKMNLVNILEPDLKATLKAGKEYVISAERKQMTSKVTITYQRNGESATFQFVAGMQGQRASASLGEASISDVAVALSEDARFTKWQINEKPASGAAAYEEPPVFADFPDDYVENIGEIIKGSPAGEVEERQLLQITPGESITVPTDSYVELTREEITADDPWIPVKYTSVHINSSATERRSSFHILTEIQQLYGQANKFVITYKLKSATGSAITISTGSTTIRAICARIRTSA